MVQKPTEDQVSETGMDATQNNDAIAVPLAATAYELLAFSFRYPAAELAEAVASGEWADAAREIADALGLAMPEGWDSGLGSYGGRDAGKLLHALRAEATRLFVGAPEPAASPYEGVWRAADDGVQALLFVNPHSMAVERLMRSCGVGRPEGTNEPLDRVDAELEFMQYLSLLGAGAAEPPEGVEVPEDGWEGARERFLDEHVRTWMPRFAESVAAESREPLFRAAALMLGEVVQ